MLNAGKNVLCEKPMGLNSKQMKEMIALAKAKKLFLMEAVWTRFNPAILHFLDEIHVKKSVGKRKINAENNMILTNKLIYFR